MRKIYIPVLVGLLHACYEDKGNYEYTAINELNIDGIEAKYALDVDDSLCIYPRLKGTLYEGKDDFSYRWEVNRQTIDTVKDLKLKVNLSLGEKLCRFIVTDKKTGVQTAVKFNVSVSSSTAGDLLMVLSDYKGNAELSYKRLDKASDFSVNYHQERWGEVLGTKPRKIVVNHDYDVNLYPFTVNATRGGLQVLLNEGLKCINKNTLEPLHDNPFISATTFAALVPPYPAPDLAGFNVQHVDYAVGTWRVTPYGSEMRESQMFMISGGAYYYYYMYTTSSPYIYTNRKSPYGGELSPCAFLPWKVYQEVFASNQKYRGYDLARNVMLFDQTVGRFTYSNFGGALVPVDALPSFAGYKLIYGTHTNTKNQCVAVLSNGSNVKVILLQAPGSASEEAAAPFQVLGQKEVVATVMNESTRFYCMNKSPYLVWATGDKIYRYNVLDIVSGGAPSPGNAIAALADFGYAGSAEITAMHVSRSERTMILGVSRYGTDTGGMSDELKGDVVMLDLNTLNITVQLREKFEGVCGYPVDVNVKHQYWYREGENNDGIMTDTI